jgi:hypothetical protein
MNMASKEAKGSVGHYGQLVSSLFRPVSFGGKPPQTGREAIPSWLIFYKAIILAVFDERRRPRKV